ncbi:hypothetical protein GQ54DRAFT_154431 [Martensiomyces pterosporus]|nr:hypothetical protein GQ54DRAFT_154431 [Martensiomyces pterosporus]
MPWLLLVGEWAAARALACIHTAATRGLLLFVCALPLWPTLLAWRPLESPSALLPPMKTRPPTHRGAACSPAFLSPLSLLERRVLSSFCAVCFSSTLLLRLSD